MIYSSRPEEKNCFKIKHQKLKITGFYCTANTQRPVIQSVTRLYYYFIVLYILVLVLGVKITGENGIICKW